jgi:hypothetical protein
MLLTQHCNKLILILIRRLKKVRLRELIKAKVGNFAVDVMKTVVVGE